MYPQDMAYAVSESKEAEGKQNNTNGIDSDIKCGEISCKNILDETISSILPTFLGFYLEPRYKLMVLNSKEYDMTISASHCHQGLSQLT